MLRAGLVLLVMTMAGAVHAGCTGEDAEHVVLARQGVTLTEDRFPMTFPAVIRQVVGEPNGKTVFGHDRFFIKGVEISVFGVGVAYPCDAPLIDVTIDEDSTARIDALDFPWFRGIDVVSEFLGASGSSFHHRLFIRRDKKFVEVTPPGEIGHTNMGGFFFGPLGKDRGNGFVIWDADWTDGAHYDPHPYDATFYRWDGAAFQSAGKVSDPKKYEISGATPDFIGLPKGAVFNHTMPYTELEIIRDGPP